MDLWRLRSTPHTGGEDMLTTIGHLVDAVLPGVQWRTTAVTHQYTVCGRQIDVLHNGEWLESAECGRIHPKVLLGSDLDPERWSGLALGTDQERALMLRKGIPGICYLRAEDPRISTQMLTQDPWQHVSPLPAARRDNSVAVMADEDEETLGDRICVALGDNADVIESLEVLSRTTHEASPAAARFRPGTLDGQVNILLRIMLRLLDRTLASDGPNAIRNAIYEAVHEGPAMELI